MVAYLKQDKIMPLPLNNIKLRGELSERMETFFYERIRSKEAHEVIFREAADAFHNQVDDENGLFGIWQGEFWGKWIISAVRVAKYSKDKEIIEFIRQGVDELLSLQQDDGYLGTYKDPLFLKVKDVEHVKSIIGYSCNWNWNIWCRKYTFWALLEAYDLLEDEKILQAADKFINQLIDMLHDNNIAVRDTGTFYGLASGSIMKPVLIMYRYTGNKKYLDFALEIAKDWEREDNAQPNLIKNALSGKAVHSWYPHDEAWAKAYEMMSCFDGLTELYRVTGEEVYLKACESFHELLLLHESNNVASVSYNDQFRHANIFLNAINEPCDAIHWMRLNYELFKITGKIKYMDIFEKTFFNAFLAGVYRDGKWGARGVRSANCHMTALLQAKFIHNHCCVNNIPRGFMNMSESCVMSNKNDVYINLYSDYDCKTDFFNLSVRWDWLNPIKINFDTQKDITVHFRIPTWCLESTLNINNKSYNTIGGQYISINLNIGKTEAILDFNLALKVEEHFENGEESEEATEWHLKRFCTDQVEKAILTEEALFAGPRLMLNWGPFILARSKYIGNSEKEMFEEPTLVGKNISFTLVPKSPEKHLLIRADLQMDNKITPICDFASAANEILEDNQFFSIFF